MAKWTDKEKAVLLSMWKDAPREKLKEALPNRSWGAISKKADYLHLTRGEGEWKEEEIAQLASMWISNKQKWELEKALFKRSWNAIRIKAGELGFNKLKSERPIVLGKKTNISHKGKAFRFGIASDTHFGSKYAQISYLIQFYKLCEKEGVETIFHAGDLSEGNGRHYIGQTFEMHIHGADNLTDFIVKNYPYFKGKTRVISGGHDLDLWKYEGYDILKRVSEQREDIEYLGHHSATIEVMGRKIFMVHPSGGTAYAISYRPQKLVESFTSENKPHIIILGHYHKAEYIPILRNVFAFQAGCFQAQTPFAVRKNLYFHYGGWIVEMGVGRGGITNMKAEFIPFYLPIKNDHERYRY